MSKIRATSTERRATQVAPTTADDGGHSNAARCEALDAATREQLGGLEELFDLGLGFGDYGAAVDCSEHDLPRTLAAARGADTRDVTNELRGDLSAGENLRIRGWALMEQMETGPPTENKDKKLIAGVRNNLVALDKSRDQAREKLRTGFRLTPESKALVGEGDLLDDVAVGANWLVEMAMAGDLFWGAFFNGRVEGESAADAGQRLGGAIAGYPNAVHYLFRVVMQRLPADRYDYELLLAALEANGMSTADFPESIGNWIGIEDAKDFEGDAALDWNRAVEEVAEIQDAFVNSSGVDSNGDSKQAMFPRSVHHFHAIRQLPRGVKNAEHVTPLTGLIRAHNHMVRYYAALSEIQGAAAGADDLAVYQAMTAHLFQAEAEWAGCVGGLAPLIADRKGFQLELSHRRVPVSSRNGELATDAMRGHVAAVVDEQRAVVTIELGARELIASEHLGVLGSDDLAIQAVEAAGRVDELLKTAAASALSLGCLGVANVPVLPKVRAFYSAGKNLTKAGAIVEEAKKAGLVKAGVDTTKAVHEIVAACAKAASGGLTALGNRLQDHGNARLVGFGDLEEGARELSRLDGIRVSRAGSRFVTAAKQLDKLGAPGDLLSAASAIVVLLDVDATSQEVRGATFDLAGAGMGLAATAAESAGVAGASTVGAGAALGLAYVKLLSDELAQVEGVAAASRATMRKRSWDNILGFANHAVKSTARAASASAAFRKSDRGVEEKAYANAVKEAERRQRYLINQVEDLPQALDATSSLSFTPDCIGWQPDAEAAVRAFRRDGASGITAVTLSEGEEEVRTKDRALAGGSLTLFEGVRAAAETFLDQGERDAR